MKTYLNTASSLGVIALGLLAGGLAACGDETSRNEDPAAKQTTASIVARGISVGGCGANGSFDIVSPSSSTESIDFVALDQSDFQDLSSQLSSFNAQNQQTLVSNSADTLDSSLQEAINEATSNTNAYQASEATQSQKSHSDKHTSVTLDVQHSDSAESTNDSSSTQWSRNSGSQRNRALSQNENSRNRRAAQNARSGNSFDNSVSTISGGGLVALPTFGLGIAGTPVSGSFSNNSGSNDNSTSSAQNAFANNFNLVSSDTSSNFANYAASSTEQHTATASANSSRRHTRSESNDSLDSASSSATRQKASQSASQASKNKSAQNSERQSHVAFQSLDSLQSKHFVLNVNLQSADNQTHTLRVFQGSNNNVASSQNFAISFPSCVGGI